MNRITWALATSAAIMMVLSPSFSIGSSCSSTVIIRKHVPIVSTATVIKEIVPVAVTTAYPVVAVPVYSYVNAPGYVPGYAPGAGYGSVIQTPGQAPGQALGQAPNADAIVDLVMRKLEQRLGGLSRTPTTTPTPGPTTSPDSGGGPPPAKARSSASFDQSKVIGLLQARCASCHSGDASAGAGISLFDSSRRLKQLPADMRIAVYNSVYEGTMPKGGNQLSDQDVELIRQWMRQR